MPSLLESFYFAFDADTSKLKRGLDDSEKQTDTLSKKLEGLDKNAKKIGIAFVDLAKSAGAALAAVVALGAVKKLVIDTAEHTFQVRQQAQALAISTEQLSAWQNAIVSAGGTAEGATQSLGTLQQKFIELARMPGGMNGDGFMLERLGLSPADMKKGIADPISAMSKLAATFGNLSAVQQQFVGRRLGFDQGTITLLAQGRRAFDEHIARMKELGVVTEKQAEASAKFKYQSAELGIVFETLARETVSTLLPPLTWLLGKIEDIVLFLREHKNFTIAFFVGLAAVAADVLVPAFASAAVAVWTFLAPIIGIPLLIGAAVAAVALLADDVYAFMNGQNSLIGEVAKKWPWFGDIVRATVESVGETLATLNAIIKDFFKYFAGLSNFLVELFTKGPLVALQNFSDKTKAIFDDLKSHFGKLWDRIVGSAQALTGNGPDQKRADEGHGAPTTSAEQKERGKYIAEKLQKMGWSPEQAAGIAGSILQESGGDPNARNKTSGAQGIAQWLGARKKAFEKYSGHALEGSSLDEQIAFMNFELTKGTEQGAGRKLKAATTPEEAARIHSQYYERPGAAEANNARREANADMIAKAQSTINVANNSPVNTQNSNVIANNRTASRTTTNTFGPTTVHTQATDPQAVAAVHAKHFQAQLKGAQDQDDDGVAA